MALLQEFNSSEFRSKNKSVYGNASQEYSEVALWSRSSAPVDASYKYAFLMQITVSRATLRG